MTLRTVGVLTRGQSMCTIESVATNKERRMRVRFICKCGLENYNTNDWLCHWKHGTIRENGFLAKYPKLRAIYYFLFTSVKFK